MSGKYTFSQALKEVRFLFCQTSKESLATRSFLARAYPLMKKSNPHIPILVREAFGTPTRVYARYEFGHEKSTSLADLSDKEIEGKVLELVTKKP
ncbi:hypothetical protein K3495_g6684 [Podosphaera aphanis]|nr:hypothetical protein K3495_g6684 [Podosphaera aphanis]